MKKYGKYDLLVAYILGLLVILLFLWLEKFSMVVLGLIVLVVVIPIKAFLNKNRK